MSEVVVPRGFVFSAGNAGIKASGKPDLALAEAPQGASAATLFTRNRVVAAPLIVGREHLKKTGGRVRAVIVNSGNANCATGPGGIDASKAVYRHGDGAPSGPTAPGAHAPNRFGLYDMHGLVREWTLDLWRESYETTPADGAPALDGQASMRVVRGGAWSDPPALLRASARGRATQQVRSDAIGFRLLRVLE